MALVPAALRVRPYSRRPRRASKRRAWAPASGRHAARPGLKARVQPSDHVPLSSRVVCPPCRRPFHRARTTWASTAQYDPRSRLDNPWASTGGSCSTKGSASMASTSERRLPFEQPTLGPSPTSYNPRAANSRPARHAASPRQGGAALHFTSPRFERETSGTPTPGPGAYNSHSAARLGDGKGLPRATSDRSLQFAVAETPGAHARRAREEGACLAMAAGGWGSGTGSGGETERLVDAPRLPCSQVLARTTLTRRAVASPAAAQRRLRRARTVSAISRRLGPGQGRTVDLPPSPSAARPRLALPVAASRCRHHHHSRHHRHHRRLRPG